MLHRTRGEDGVVAVLTALLVTVVLLPLAALGLSAYVRAGVAGEMQRAADAGSLAAATSLKFVDTNGLDPAAVDAEIKAGPACRAALSSLDGDGTSGEAVRDRAPLSTAFASDAVTCAPGFSPDILYPQCITGLVQSAQLVLDDVNGRLTTVAALVGTLTGGLLSGGGSGLLSANSLGSGSLVGGGGGTLGGTTSGSPTETTTGATGGTFGSVGGGVGSIVDPVVGGTTGTTTEGTVGTATGTVGTVEDTVGPINPGAVLDPGQAEVVDMDLQRRLVLSQKVFALIPAAAYDGISVDLDYRVKGPLDGLFGRTTGTTHEVRGTARRLFKPLLPRLDEAAVDALGDRPGLNRAAGRVLGPRGEAVLTNPEAYTVMLLQLVLAKTRDAIIDAGGAGESVDDTITEPASVIAMELLADTRESLLALGVPALVADQLTLPLPTRANPLDPECQQAAAELVRALTRALEINEHEQDLTHCVTYKLLLGQPDTLPSCTARLFRAQLRPNTVGLLP